MSFRRGELVDDIWSMTSRRWHWTTDENLSIGYLVDGIWSMTFSRGELVDGIWSMASRLWHFDDDSSWYLVDGIWPMSLCLVYCCVNPQCSNHWTCARPCVVVFVALLCIKFTNQRTQASQNDTRTILEINKRSAWQTWMEHAWAWVGTAAVLCGRAINVQIVGRRDTPALATLGISFFKT